MSPSIDLPDPPTNLVQLLLCGIAAFVLSGIWGGSRSAVGPSRHPMTGHPAVFWFTLAMSVWAFTGAILLLISKWHEPTQWYVRLLLSSLNSYFFLRALGELEYRPGFIDRLVRARLTWAWVALAVSALVSTLTMAFWVLRPDAPPWADWPDVVLSLATLALLSYTFTRFFHHFGAGWMVGVTWAVLSWIVAAQIFEVLRPPDHLRWTIPLASKGGFFGVLLMLLHTWPDFSAGRRAQAYEDVAAPSSEAALEAGRPPMDDSRRASANSDGPSMQPASPNTLARHSDANGIPPTEHPATSPPFQVQCLALELVNLDPVKRSMRSEGFEVNIKTNVSEGPRVLTYKPFVLFLPLAIARSRVRSSDDNGALTLGPGPGQLNVELTQLRRIELELGVPPKTLVRNAGRKKGYYLEVPPENVRISDRWLEWAQEHGLVTRTPAARCDPYSRSAPPTPQRRR